MKLKQSILILGLLFLSLNTLRAQNVYVMNKGADSISVINIDTNMITDTITLGVALSLDSLAINPNGESIYVSDAWGTIYIINTTTNTLTDIIDDVYDLSLTPSQIVFTPNGEFAYMSHNKSVIVIDTKKRKVTDIIKICLPNVKPWGMSINDIIIKPDGKFVYIAVEYFMGRFNEDLNYVGDDIYAVQVIDTATNTLTDAKIDGKNTAFTVNPTGEFVYLVDSTKPIIRVVNTDTNRESDAIEIGYGVVDIVISPDSKFVYAMHFSYDKIIVINAITNEVTDTIELKSKTLPSPLVSGMTINPNGKYLYVIVDSPNLLKVIDTATNEVVDTIALSRYWPCYIVVAPQ